VSEAKIKERLLKKEMSKKGRYVEGKCEISYTNVMKSMGSIIKNQNAGNLRTSERTQRHKINRMGMFPYKGS
jgi:hypothetical protein